MMTEEFSGAIEAYRNDKSPENVRALRTMLQKYVAMQKEAGTPLAAIGPFLGIADAIDLEYETSWKGRAVMWAFRIALRPDRPGWNDYWMARWMVTREPEAVKEIHRRAAHIPPIGKWYVVAETAAWMVNSTMVQDHEFNHAYSDVLRQCEICKGAYA